MIHHVDGKNTKATLCGMEYKNKATTHRGWKKVDCPECMSARLARSDENKRRMQLWKAAPELLLACKGALNCLLLGEHVDKQMAIDYLREVIQKAERGLNE